MKQQGFVFCFLIFTLLTVGFVPRASSASPAITRIYIDPVTQTADVGSSFSVSIRIEDAHSLYSYELYLGFYNTVLSANSVVEGDFPGLSGVYDTLFVPKIFQSMSYVSIWNTLYGAPTGVEGSGTLATVNFDVVGAGESGLYLYDVILVDDFGDQIKDVTWEDGYFNVEPVEFSVTPSSVSDSTILVGDSFSVNVSISNVAELRAFRFRLAYDNTVLNVTEVSVISFLNEPVTVEKDLNNTLGFVSVNATSDADELASGSGTLANVTFVVLAVETSAFDLYDTRVDDKLARLKEPPFQHSPPAQDGYFSNIPAGHDIFVWRVTVLPKSLTAGEKMTINASINNVGAYNETFEVTAYYDSTEIGKQSDVSVLAGAKTVVTFIWDTTGVAAGTYAIKVVASTVEGETKVTNNSLTYSAVTIESTPTSNLWIYIGVAIVVVAAGIVIFYFVRMRKPKPT